MFDGVLDRFRKPLSLNSERRAVDINPCTLWSRAQRTVDAVLAYNGEGKIVEIVAESKLAKYTPAAKSWP